MPVYRLSKAQVMACGDISMSIPDYPYAFPTPFLRLSYTFPTILNCCCLGAGWGTS